MSDDRRGGQIPGQIAIPHLLLVGTNGKQLAPGPGKINRVPSRDRRRFTDVMRGGPLPAEFSIRADRDITIIDGQVNVSGLIQGGGGWRDAAQAQPPALPSFRL